ncbi:hypothetical protein AYI69_g1102 [Smittium culicis]|uniref:Uncharacterized protein n=1 Tax=Smittium culicis TaxID=133412 RepID=A0A1R1YR77_9FUNG|nr:hypothetical protein AYI69_g1102 [Smittium culicis]
MKLIMAYFLYMNELKYRMISSTVLSNVILALDPSGFNNESRLNLASYKYDVDDFDGELNSRLDKATTTYNHRIEDLMNNGENSIKREFDEYINSDDSESLQDDTLPQIQNFNCFNSPHNPGIHKCNPNYNRNKGCRRFLNKCNCNNCKPIILTRTVVRIGTKTLTFTNTYTVTHTKTKVKLLLLTTTVSRSAIVTELSTVTYTISNTVTSTATETETETQIQTQVVPTTTTKISTSTETKFVPTTTTQTETTITTKPTTTTETSTLSIPFTTTATTTITVIDIPEELTSTTSTRSREFISLTPV